MPPTVTRRRARAILRVLLRLAPEERARVLCRVPERPLARTSAFEPLRIFGEGAKAVGPEVA